MSRPGAGPSLDYRALAIHGGAAPYRSRSLTGGVRRNAAQALGYLSDPVAVEASLAQVTDPDATVRSEVVAALGRLRDPRAIPTLIQALNDPSTFTQSSAAVALGSIGELAFHPLLTALRQASGQARPAMVKALGLLGSIQAHTTLLAELGHSDPQVRVQAAESLGYLEDKRAGPALDHSRGISFRGAGGCSHSTCRLASNAQFRL